MHLMRKIRLEMPPQICYIETTRGTTAHKGLTRIRIEKPPVPVKYQGGFSYVLLLTKRKNERK